MTALKKFLGSNFYPCVFGLMACLLVSIKLDVADECSWTLNGPGLTLDENLNVAGGVYVVESVLDAGLAALDPRTFKEIFNSPNYYPDYPPLGRIPLGLSNAVLSRTGGLDDHPFYFITYARLGSAIAFGLLVTLLATFTRRYVGLFASVVTGISIILMPRVFGHAHLASVETTLNLTYALATLTCLHLLAGKEELKARDGILPGIALGLLLLTKIQAIFLPPVIVVWMLWHWRIKGILPLAVLAATSAVVFFIGWPWLWTDTFSRVVQYFGQTTDRAVLYCYYLGSRYADKSVPWHYPFVTFLTTTPLLWLVLGGWGMALARASSSSHSSSKSRSRKEQQPGSLTPRQNHLLLGAFWLPLVVFAIPGVPVYDGERLFLMIWPLFSIWVGAAAVHAVRLMDGKFVPAVRNGICAVAVLIPVISMWTLDPCQLSFFDLQVGGLRGAAAMGMERDYWGTSLTADFLEEACGNLPEGTTIAVAPVLHPMFPQFLKQDSWLLHRPDLQVVAYDDQQPTGPRHVLLLKRMADQWPSLIHRPAATRVLKQQTRQGVVLAEMLELPDPQAETTLNDFDQAREQQRQAIRNARANMIRERSLTR